MKKQFSLKQVLVYSLLLLPALVSARTKNLLSTHRVFPKMEKIAEFEKALAVHAQKYHTGDVHWRVFFIQSGPDAGGYHITEGPISWEAEDARGDLGPEHTADWNKNVSVHLTDRQSSGYSVYLDSLSTIAVGDFTDKINISHVYPKVAKGDEVVKLIKKLKKTWTASGVYDGGQFGADCLFGINRSCYISVRVGVFAFCFCHSYWHCLADSAVGKY